jgi:sialic acid synthase SpsE
VTEIVAEISGSHGGSFDNALELIHAAADAGADAVKFQCFDPERLAARRENNPEVLALAGNVALLVLYRWTHTPRAWFPELIDCAQANGLKWFSSVFDPDDVAFLETLDCPRYKISAFEMLDWDIIKAVRETGKPIVMSVRPTSGVTIMQATDYAGQIVPLGLSAHGDVDPIPHCPMVEYHLKLDDVETPDSAFSLTAKELRGMVAMIRHRERRNESETKQE